MLNSHSRSTLQLFSNHYLSSKRKHKCINTVGKLRSGNILAEVQSSSENPRVLVYRISSLDI